MTGSIHQLSRQHSSTATTNTTMEKNFRPKLRRCSSADDHGLMESMVDIHQQKDFPVFKREYATSDIDSGTEEIEQQFEHVAITESFDIDDQSSVKSFGHFDEGFSECYRDAETPTEESKRPMIEDDRKFHHHFFAWSL